MKREAQLSGVFEQHGGDDDFVKKWQKKIKFWGHVFLRKCDHIVHNNTHNPLQNISITWYVLVILFKSVIPYIYTTTIHNKSLVTRPKKNSRFTTPTTLLQPMRLPPLDIFPAHLNIKHLPHPTSGSQFIFITSAINNHDNNKQQQTTANKSFGACLSAAAHSSTIHITQQWVLSPPLQPVQRQPQQHNKNKNNPNPPLNKPFVTNFNSQWTSSPMNPSPRASGSTPAPH